MKRVATLLAAGLLAAACADGALGLREEVRRERNVELGREFTLGVHEMALVEGTHVFVFFDGVTEDSRCPTGAVCVWEGNAAARLDLSSDIAEFAPQPRTLNTALEPRATDFLGLTIRLVDVTPHPRLGGPEIDRAQYVVKLVATRS